jgi:hypothetical protein
MSVETGETTRTAGMEGHDMHTVYILTSIRKPAYAHTHTRTHTHTHTLIHTHTGTARRAGEATRCCTHTHTHAHKYNHTHTHTHTHIHTHKQTHTHTHTHSDTTQESCTFSPLNSRVTVLFSGKTAKRSVQRVTIATNTISFAVLYKHKHIHKHALFSVIIRTHMEFINLYTNTQRNTHVMHGSIQIHTQPDDDKGLELWDKVLEGSPLTLL